MATRRVLMIAVAIAALMIAKTVRAEIRLAYVDIQRALNECENGKKARTEMQARAVRVEDRLKAQQAEVQRLQDELEKKGMLMKRDQAMNLRDEYNSKLRDFQQSYKNARDELQEKDNEMTGAIVHDLANVVRTIGEKHGYTLVMEKGGLLWGIPSIDITDEVIRAYNELHVTAGSMGSDEESGFATSKVPGGRAKRGASLGGGLPQPMAPRSTIGK